MRKGHRRFMTRVKCGHVIVESTSLELSPAILCEAPKRIHKKPATVLSELRNHETANSEDEASFIASMLGSGQLRMPVSISGWDACPEIPIMFRVHTCPYLFAA